MAATTTTTATGTIMSDEQFRFLTPALLRLQSWLSPAFPIGSYSYSHASNGRSKRATFMTVKVLSSWLEADLCYGSGRNEAIFFSEAWYCAMETTGRDCSRSRNSRPLIAEHRNLRLNPRSKGRPASRPCAMHGPIRSWTGFRKYLPTATSRRPWPSFLAWRGKAGHSS